jgi:hypothetical protein
VDQYSKNGERRHDLGWKDAGKTTASVEAFRQHYEAKGYRVGE